MQHATTPDASIDAARTPGAGRPLRRHPQLWMQYDEGGRLMVETGTESGRLEASRDVIEVIELADGSRSRDDVEASFARPGLAPAAGRSLARAVIDRLLSRGILFEGDAPSLQAPPYGYARPDIHRTMLQDKARTDAFRDALREVVRPGDVVVDLGTGSGILAMFAAEAGAARVHAVEATSIVEQARLVAARNGLTSIQFHHADAESVQIPELADVLVSEWLGHFVFISDGMMFAAVAGLRDRVLKPGGIMVPASVDMLLAPITDPDGEGAAWWGERPYGFDFGPLQDEEYRYTHIRLVPAESRIAAPRVVKTLDCYTTRAQDLVFSCGTSFEVERDEVFHGFCGHFTCQLSPGVLLDTGPDAAPTHWQQQLFPVRPVPVRRGDRIEVTLHVAEAPQDPRLARLSLEGRVVSSLVGEQRFAHVYDE